MNSGSTTQSTGWLRILITIMMKIGLVVVVVLLLSSGVSGLGSVISRYYHHMHSHLTWQEARDECRSSYQYTDLATIYAQTDIEFDMTHYCAWIGYYRYKKHWYWTSGYSAFHKWAHQQPHNEDDCACVTWSDKKFDGADCEGYNFFICHKYNNYKFNYTFIPQSATWSEAKQYCRNEFDDVAVIYDNDDLGKAVEPRDFPIWTGLHKDGGAWKWSTGFLSEYTNWAPNEPDNKGDCVSVSSLSKLMATQNCSARFPSICYRENLILVKENKTWEEALEHCRALQSPYNHYHHYELLSVQPADNNIVMSKLMAANTVKVWVGLRFLAGKWVWVNGADLLYPDLPVCPHAGQRCGALSMNGTVSVETIDCTEKWNFLCYTP